MKKNNKITLNDKACSVNDKVCIGDQISFILDFDEDNDNIIPTRMDIDIIYEDDAYLVINKPSNIPIHPSMLHFEDSLSNGVRYYFDKIGLKKKIRPVNRLDKDTSGVVIFAKNEYIQECLVRQMKNKCFTKEYLAICEGVFDEGSKKRNYKCSYCKKGK